MPETSDISRSVKSGAIDLDQAWRSLDYASELVCDVIGWRLVARLGPELGKLLAGPGALHILDSSNVALTARLGTLTPVEAQVLNTFCESYPEATPN